MSSIPPPHAENQAWPSQDVLVSGYGQVCDEYGRVEQLRSTLLTSIPGVSAVISGASIFLGTTSSATFTHFLIVLGILGMCTTFGLYYRELEYEMETLSLGAQLKFYEVTLRIPNTFSTPRDRRPVYKFKKEYATYLAYGSAFTFWFCVATWFVFPKVNGFGLAFILALPVLLVIMYVQGLMRVAKLKLPHMQQLGVHV